MSFQAAILSALDELRPLAESLYLDTCMVRYDTGTRGPQDEETGEEPIIYDVELPLVKCKAQTRATGGSFAASEAGEREVLLANLEIHMPQSTPEIRDDAQIVYLSAHAVSMQWLVGKVFRVRSRDYKTLGTALRLAVEDITAEVEPVVLP